MILPSINVFFVIYSVCSDFDIKNSKNSGIKTKKKLKIHKNLKLVKNY